jgi:ribulose-phosphate 3-epimerase
MLNIIPAILTSNPLELKSMIRSVEGLVERVQIDIIDGIFADNKTIEPLLLKSAQTGLALDFQLMVKEPINWIEKCPARVVQDRIIGHVEMMSSQFRFIEKLKFNNLSAGLALDITTPISIIEEGIIQSLDVILLMSVKAGFGGQKFNKNALPKIAELNSVKKATHAHFKICVDGGITLELIKALNKLSIDEVAVGRRIFQGDVANNIRDFKNSINL